MRLLAADLSTNVGFALFLDGAKPKCGTYRLPKAYNPDDYAARTWPLMQWLEQIIALDKPDVIAYESPFIPLRPTNDAQETGVDGKPTFKTTQHALRLQIALATVIETVAKKHAIKCYEVATASAKVALAGSARLADKKKDMVIAATRRGFFVADDHQADAIGVGLVVLDMLGFEAP